MWYPGSGVVLHVRSQRGDPDPLENHKLYGFANAALSALTNIYHFMWSRNWRKLPIPLLLLAHAATSVPNTLPLLPGLCK